MRLKCFFGGLFAIAAIGTSSALASIAYDNGSVVGNTAVLITPFGNFNNQVSDSFTLAGAATLTSAQVGLWVFSGVGDDNPTSVDWSIGTGAFGSDKGFGTGSLTNTVLQTGIQNGQYDLLESTFSLNVTLAAGTYWFTLQNAVLPSGDVVYWDQNGGPSLAQGNILGSVGPIPSESFQLYGAQLTAVPESSAIVTWCGLGMLVLVSYGRRRRQQVTV